MERRYILSGIIVRRFLVSFNKCKNLRILVFIPKPIDKINSLHDAVANRSYLNKKCV